MVVLLLLALVMIPHFAAEVCTNYKTNRKEKIKFALDIACEVMGCIAMLVGVAHFPFIL